MDIFDQITVKPQPIEPEKEQTTETPASVPVPESTTHQYTPMAIKQCSQELLKFGLLEAVKKPKLYQSAIAHFDTINILLEPFDLALRIDDIRGLAYLVTVAPLMEDAEEDSWSHPLVRRQRLNLEQSLLIAILRKQFLKHEQEVGVGASGALVHLDELITDLQLFLGDPGSESREQSRLRGLLDKLKGHGIVSEIDNNDQVTIRPIIAHIANPENLKALLDLYRRQGRGATNA